MTYLSFSLSDVLVMHLQLCPTNVDCGAGIGRVTKNLLIRYFNEVKLVFVVVYLLTNYVITFNQSVRTHPSEILFS